MHELGLLCLASGERGIRFRPAMNLLPEDLAIGLEMLRQAVRQAR